MTSLRHNADGERSPRDSYLDAARACILDVGWRRTTLTEVARRAGVSRMTIYRTWPDMPRLLADLMTREWGELVADTTSAYEGTVPGPRQIADALVRAVKALRDNELFVRIVELDPELILPYLLARRGRSQELVLEVLVAAVWAGQKAGTIRKGDAETIGRALLLAVHGFVLSAQTMIDDDVTEADLDAELRHLVVEVLAP